MEAERRLWFAVIEKAIEDARGEYIRGEGKARNAMQEAREWLLDGNDDFKAVCDLAGVHPEHVHRLIRRDLPGMAPKRRKSVVMDCAFAFSAPATSFAASCV